MVSAQVILLVIGVIGFFATGGIGKTKTAIKTARQDFMLVKEKVTDQVEMIKAKNKAGLGGQEA